MTCNCETASDFCYITKPACALCLRHVMPIGIYFYTKLDALVNNKTGRSCTMDISELTITCLRNNIVSFYRQEILNKILYGILYGVRVQV